MRIGVPQGSLLGPILFILYTKDLEIIARRYGFEIHLYADDTQLYVCFKSNDEDNVLKRVEKCLDDIEIWMKSNFLQLNVKKTQFMHFKSRKSERTPRDIKICNNLIKPIPIAKTLGVELDDKLTMKKMVSEKCRIAFYHLRNLGRIKYSLSKDLRITLVNILIHSKLDYCNSLLANCPKYLINKLQSVQNAAIRFIFNAKKRTPTSKLLKEAHFLPVEYRIKFKLCMLAHKSLIGESPGYIQEELKLYKPTRPLRVGRDVLSIVTEKLQKDTISSKIAEEWNKLPFTLQATLQTKTFSKLLKTYFFKESFKC